MKISLYNKAQIVMNNPFGKHNYFAWPTAVRLQNGKIAVVASGYRLGHICPFGKTVISYSEDEGKTYTMPAPVIDTVLDDRDGGIMTFGSSGVIVTSFNNSVNFQKKHSNNCAYSLSYLDMITQKEEEKYIGSTFRISMDCGVTFGELYKSPVTCPHGPIELADGTILYVGRGYEEINVQDNCIMAYTLNTEDGSMKYLSKIENVLPEINAVSCEPNIVQLDDGRILCHIRVHKYCVDENERFTVFQSESCDNGKSWTKPEQILGNMGGSPPHLFRHSSGMLICTYCDRRAPFTIKAMFSKDCGKSWDIDNDIYVNNVDADMGYPSTVELDDGTLITVFYAHVAKGEPAVIMQQHWDIKG